MTDFFQIISAKITTFITVVIITVTSILPWSVTNTNKPADTSIASPSASVSESPSPFASPTVKSSISNQPGQKQTSEKVTPSLSPQNNNNQTTNQPKTYSIVPLGNTSSYSIREQVLLNNAYREFLLIPNLRYMDYQTQNQLLNQIVEKYYAQYKRELEQEIQQAKENIKVLQNLLPTLTSAPVAPTTIPIYINTEVESKLAELRQTLEYIQNQPVAMNVIYGRMERAYQDWIKNNPEIYSAILGSRYINDLNAILRAYGL